MDAVLRRLLLVAALLFVALPSQAATVTKIGECTANFAANCSITASSGVAQTHGVILVAFSGGSPTSTFTATDSASNTYQTDAHLGANSKNFYALSAYLATAIASSGTITVTPSNGTNERWHMVAYDASTFASTAWKDQSATNTNGNGTSWASGTTAATVHQPNINFVVYVAAVSTTISYGGSWAALDTALVDAGRYLYTAWKEVTSTGAQSETATSGAADNPVGGIVSYKEGSGGAPPCANSITLMGAGCK